MIRMAAERWRADDAGAASEERGDPVLLLHGFAGTPRMLRPLGRHLRRALRRPTFDVALGLGLGDIRDAALRVQRLLDERNVSCCDAVGYSMGGLVATYLSKCLDQGRRVRSVTTLGTPHRGVPLVSRWPAALSWWCRSAEQMREGSDFLEALGRIEPPAGTAWLSIAGADDGLVPPTAARLDGPCSRNRVIPRVDHLGLLTSRRAFRCVEQALWRSRAAVEPGWRSRASAAAGAGPHVTEPADELPRAAALSRVGAAQR